MDANAPSEKKLAQIYEYLHKYLLNGYKAGKYQDKSYTSPKAQ